MGHIAIHIAKRISNKYIVWLYAIKLLCENIAAFRMRFKYSRAKNNFGKCVKKIEMDSMLDIASSLLSSLYVLHLSLTR